MLPDAAALCHVPGLGPDGRALAIQRLAGGSVNEVFRVDTAAGRFVLRLDGPDWRRPGVDRQRERLLHARAAAAGLAPPLVYASADSGTLVMEYLDGRVWEAADCADAAQLARLGQRLAALHRLPVPSVKPFDPLAVAGDYAAICARRGDVRLQQELGAVMAGVEAAAVLLAASTRPRCIVHGDLVHSNLLETDRLWLLDWEYAQVSDPLMDVAGVLAYYPAARAHVAVLLAAAGLAADVAELQPRVYLYEALTWLWYRARGEAAAPPAHWHPPGRPGKLAAL